MAQYEDQLPHHALRGLVDIGAQAVKISSLQEIMARTDAQHTRLHANSQTTIGGIW
jgi:hypothetical protein